jgi:lycopene cyclase domain-containing protein
MTYLGFLIGFVLLPIILLSTWFIYKKIKGNDLNSITKYFLPGYSFLLLSGLALVYTTPWDNYLVANGVWWYDPDLVLGIIIGWVPLEEYLFFILQPILGGLLLLLVLSRLANEEKESTNPHIRKIAVSIAVIFWLVALGLLIFGPRAGTYLGLELAWALPVMILQLAFGADILWKHRRVLAAVILGLTVYLSLADSIAIKSGVWTIDPEQSLGLLLGGILPIEEFVFFLVTNIMVGFGFVLIWSPESMARLATYQRKLKSRGHIPGLSSEG